MIMMMIMMMMMMMMMMMKTMMVVVRRKSVTSLLALLQRVIRRNVREREGLPTPSIRATRNGHVDLFLSSSLEGEIEFRSSSEISRSFVSVCAGII